MSAKFWGDGQSAIIELEREPRACQAGPTVCPNEAPLQWRAFSYPFTTPEEVRLCEKHARAWLDDFTQSTEKALEREGARLGFTIVVQQRERLRRFREDALKELELGQS